LKTVETKKSKMMRKTKLVKEHVGSIISKALDLKNSQLFSQIFKICRFDEHQNLQVLISNLFKAKPNLQ